MDGRCAYWVWGVEVVVCLRHRVVDCLLTSLEVREVKVRGARRGFVCREIASLENHLTFSLYITSSIPQYFHQSWSFGIMAQWFNEHTLRLDCDWPAILQHS
jgi:hypothetical protein